MNIITKQRDFYIHDLGYKESAIYIITNSSNNKVYIGQAINYWRRAKAHRCSLERGVCYNEHMQNSYNLNTKLFSIRILEKVESENLNQRERYWIKFYNANNSNNGYNLTEGGHGEERIYLKKEDYRKRRSEILKKLIERGTAMDRRVPILAYNILTENFIKEYPSIKEAAKDLNLDASTIADCVYGKNNQTKGFTFRRKVDSIIPPKIEFKLGQKKKSRLIAKLNVETGEVIERFLSIYDIVPIIGYTYGSILRIFRKRGHLIHGGFKYIYP